MQAGDATFLVPLPSLSGLALKFLDRLVVVRRCWNVASRRLCFGEDITDTRALWFLVVLPAGLVLDLVQFGASVGHRVVANAAFVVVFHVGGNHF